MMRGTVLEMQHFVQEEMDGVQRQWLLQVRKTPGTTYTATPLRMQGQWDQRRIGYI